MRELTIHYVKRALKERGLVLRVIGGKYGVSFIGGSHESFSDSLEDSYCAGLAMFRELQQREEAGV